MRITRKFTIALTCAILAVLSVNSIIRVKREIALFEADIPNDNRLLGRTIGGAVARVWRRGGEADALDLIEDANERESNILIRWVWLDAPPGDAQAPTVPAGARVATGADNIMTARWRAPEDSDESLYTYVPVDVPGPRKMAIELHESLGEQQRYVRRTILHASIATATLVVVCALLAMFVGVVFVGRPVRQLVEHARRLGEGDLSSRLELRQRDEIGTLGKEMNELSKRLAAARDRVEAETAARLAAIDQLQHADRLATVGKLSAGIAHEVGTPLNIIMGHAQLITDEYPQDSPAHVNAEIVDQQAHRVTKIIRQLLDFARPKASQKLGHDLAGIARQVVVLLESMAQKRNVVIDLDSPAAVLGRVDAVQLQQVIMNLVVNAIHATASAGKITVGISRRQVTPPGDHGGPAGPYACVSVRDPGAGIRPEHLPRIFEPFFTTKDVGDGTGLGLSVAYGIVKEHGGWIDVDSELGTGSCFSIYLPLEEAA